MSIHCLFNNYVLEIGTVSNEYAIPEISLAGIFKMLLVPYRQCGIPIRNVTSLLFIEANMFIEVTCPCRYRSVFTCQLARTPRMGYHDDCIRPSRNKIHETCLECFRNIQLSGIGFLIIHGNIEIINISSLVPRDAD